jgi:glycosyltransferase involved in cell wall biosynthesis
VGVHGHVAIICPALGSTGSVASVALHHAKELSTNFQVTLASDSFLSAGTPRVVHLKLSPVRFGILRRLAHVPNEIAFAVAARKAIEQLHAKNPVDFIICHGHPVATLAAVPLQNRLGISYALVTHGDIFDRPKGTYDTRLTWFYRRTTPRAYRNADLVIALSPYMAALATRGGAKEEHVSLIPNGIDPAEIGLDDGQVIPPRDQMGRLELLFVGRLSVEKGGDLLLEAAAQLVKRGVVFRLRVAGAGPDAERLKQLAARLHLLDKVEFIGRVPREQLGLLYLSSDVVCVPSRSESFGLVVLEAMAAGVAVVGADTGGISFLVKHATTGLVFQSGDSTALAGALARFGQEQGLGQRMGEAALARARKEFSWAKIGELLTVEIKRALERKSTHY